VRRLNGNQECFTVLALVLCCACTDLAADAALGPEDSGPRSDAGDAGGDLGLDSGPPADGQVGGSGGGGANVGGRGGSGGDDSGTSDAGDTGTDLPNEPPVVAIDFPPNGLTRLETIHARGTLDDPDGDEIASLRVNGVQATIDGNEWSAVVPLAPGDNALVATAEDARGATGASPAAQVTRVVLQLEMPIAFAYDEASDRALVLDSSGSDPEGDLEYALYWVAASTREVTLVSSHERGNGPAFDQPMRIAYDPSSARAFVLDTNAVMAIDVATGNRTILSNTTTPAQPGGGPPFVSPTDLVFDAAGERLLVVDHGANALFAVNANTGVRSVLSDAADGSRIFEDSLIAYDPLRNRVYAIVNGGYPVMAIDLDDGGARTRIADENDGRGYHAHSWHAIAVDSANYRLLLLQYSRVIELDLSNGSRRMLADVSLSDPSIDSTGLAVNAQGDEVVMLNRGEGRILRCPLGLDPTRFPLSNQLHGSGPRINPYAVVAEAGYALIVDAFGRQLVRVELATGDRTVLSSAAVGTGTAFSFPSGLALDVIGDRALVLDGATLLAVDLTSGDRSVISRSFTPAVGTGPAIGSPAVLSGYVDTENDRIMLISGTSLMAIDLSTGNRSVFSGTGTGTGHLPSALRDLTYDFSGERYLAIGNDDHVIAIDRSTGNRTVISGPMAGSTGPAFSNPVTIDYDNRNNLAWVVDHQIGLYAVALRDGTRKLVQPLNVSINDMAVAAERGLAVIAVTNELVRLEIAAPRFTEFYAPPQRGTPALYVMDGFADGQVHGFAEQGIILADLPSAATQEIFGSGSWPTFLVNGFLDRAGGRLYGLSAPFLWSGRPGVSYASLDTGDRVLLSDEQHGTGPLLSGPIAGAMDTRRMRPLVLDRGLPAILAVDPASGNRTNLSGGPIGAGPAWDQPRAMLYDAEHDRVLVLEPNTLLSVDLASGDRSVVSGGEVGSGPDLSTGVGMTLDSVSDRVIVRDTGQGTFVAIDLASGERSLLVRDLAPADTSFLFITAAGSIAYDPERRAVLAYSFQSSLALVEFDEISGDWIVVLGRVPWIPAP
jgi:hypothetical protein